MGKIKVAQIITRLDWGGSPDIFRMLADGLDPEKFDVRLIIGRTGHPSAKTLAFLRRFVRRTTVIKQLQRDINPFKDLSAFFKLYASLRREKFDVAHTHTAKAGALGRLAAWFAGVPKIVHTPHGHNFYGYFGGAASRIIIIAERILAGFTDKIIALTELEKDDLQKFSIAGDEKIALIYQGLKLDLPAADKDTVRRNFNIMPGENVVGMIGRLEPVKGPEYFLQAAQEVSLEFNNIKFLLVGEGSLRIKLEKMARDSGMADKFIFTGWREDVPDILSILDIMVLPSLNEAVGISLVQAQYLGVPVVATRVGGVPEVVNDNITGMLVPPADAHSLAVAISILLKDAQKRVSMGEAAKTWVAGKFKAEEMIAKISELYNEPAARKPRFKLLRSLLRPLVGMALITLACFYPSAFAKDLIQVPAAIQISSRVSDGQYTIPEIIDIAKRNNIRILILTDRDLMRWEYGLWPLRNIIKKTVEGNSIFKYGIRRYLKEIDSLQEENKDLLLMPGIESSAFYCWLGWPLGRSFKIMNWHKHIIAIGLDKPGDLRNLPVAGNFRGLAMPFRFKNLLNLWPILLLPAGFYYLRKPKFDYKDSEGRQLAPRSNTNRAAGIILISTGALFLLNNYPFCDLKFDQYRGDLGTMPYQNLIDYVEEKGGVTFWAHPEAEYIAKQGKIGIETHSYADYLLKTKGYTGFAMFYESYRRIAPPGGIWDKALGEYCEGKRADPVWVIGGLGYDDNGDLNDYLRDLKTVFLLSAVNRQEVLGALKKGRMYLVRGRDSSIFTLDEFMINDSAGSAEAIMGGEASVSGKPVIRVKGHFSGGKKILLKIRLIRNGEIINTIDAATPFEISYQDEDILKSGKSYYRAEIVSGDMLAVVNPIFVIRK